MKRSLSESENDDIYSADEKETDDSSTGGVTRKRRRGIIEKRRRDRINNSLSELRRLVPAAYEKQGSAKLEKAEILQMTVDHLKILHAKGVDALSYDTNKIALDYHSIGFRECSAEVGRYLVAVEGLDVQNPLKLRLLSHLQCFIAQKAASSWMSWGTGGTSTPTAHGSTYGHSSFQGPSMLTPPHHHSGTPHTQLDQSHMSAFTAPNHPQTSDLSFGHTPVGPQISSHERVPTTGSGAPHILHVSMGTAAAAASQSYPSSYHLNLHSYPSSNHHHQHHQQTPISSSSSTTDISPNQGVISQAPMPPSNLPLLHSGYSSSLHQTATDAKPYRPWGAEIAY